jgi:hypothetical protein
VPSVLKEWLPLVNEAVQSLNRSQPELGDVVVAVSHGPAGRHLEKWIDTTAISHILAWRFDNATKVEVDESDRTLPCGSEGTRWVFDRFSRTYLSDWQRYSLDWELAFLREPERVAASVGLSVEMLLERPTSEGMVLDQLACRILDAQVHDPVIADLSRFELIEQLVALLQADQIDQARLLARRALDASPTDAALQNAHAFCSIPLDARISLSTLKSLEGAVEPQVRLANEASAMLVLGDKDGAETALRALESEGASNVVAWLWVPSSLLPHAAPSIEETRIGTWVSRAQLVLEGSR